MMRVNETGLAHAYDLIQHGKVSAGVWQFDDEDEAALKGPMGTDRATHEKHHLAIDDAHPEGHPDRTRYPFAKDGQVYLRALHGIRSEAHDAGQTEIERNASALIGDAKARLTPDERSQKWTVLRALRSLFGESIPAPDLRHIVKDGSKWKLYTKDGSRLLGTHATKEEAEAQESALHASEAAAAGAHGRASTPHEPRIVPAGVERRFIARPVEIRASEKGPGKIRGYAANFGTYSVDLGGFRERLARGCFRDCLAAGDDPRCLRNHDDNMLLGRRSAGTLALDEDDEGLVFECDLPDTQNGRDTAELIRRRDITGCSFQFTIAEASWDFSLEVPLRTVTRVGKLYDVGPVTFPAYESTSVDMRSFEAAKALHIPALALRVQKSISQAKARQRQAEALLP